MDADRDYFRTAAIVYAILAVAADTAWTRGAMAILAAVHLLILYSKSRTPKSPDLGDGQWHDVVIRRTGDTEKVWIDGKLLHR